MHYYYRNPDVRCVTVSQDKGPITKDKGMQCNLCILLVVNKVVFFDNDDLDSYTGQYAIKLG